MGQLESVMDKQHSIKDSLKFVSSNKTLIPLQGGIIGVFFIQSAFFLIFSFYTTFLSCYFSFANMRKKKCEIQEDKVKGEFFFINQT